MSTPTGQRSRKDLACTAAATAHQKAFGAELKQRVVNDGEPFALVQADTPHEIFHMCNLFLLQLPGLVLLCQMLSTGTFKIIVIAAICFN